jgi:hypothetical protein
VPFMSFTVPADFRAAMASIGDAAGNIPADEEWQRRLAYLTASEMLEQGILPGNRSEAIEMVMQRTGVSREYSQYGVAIAERAVSRLGVLLPIATYFNSVDCDVVRERAALSGAMPSVVIEAPKPSPANPQPFERPKRRINLG